MNERSLTSDKSVAKCESVDGIGETRDDETERRDDWAENDNRSAAELIH